MASPQDPERNPDQTPEPAPAAADAAYAQLFDLGPLPAVVTRLGDNTILAVNQAAADLVGVPQRRIVGQSVLVFYADPGARDRLVEAIRRDGRADNIPIHIGRPGGDRSWVQANSRKVEFGGGPAILTVFHDITDQIVAEQALRASEQRLATQSRVLTELTGRHIDRRGSFDDELRDILRATSETLRVARVSMWRIDDGRRAITCVCMYHRAENRFDSGAVLLRDGAPDYFTALERDRVIASEDVLSDPRTREFKESYLAPNGIGAMLDVPLRENDEMYGVLCSEHVGGRREWMVDEQNFAVAASNLIVVALTDDELRRAKKATGIS
jgi:PAS domain S-box-containing protein